MKAWDINPAGVKDVLTKVGAKADDMSKDLAKQNFDHLGAALKRGAKGLLGEVPAAVNGLMADQSDDFTTIGNRIQAGIIGVTDATIAFHNAQVEMSDETNRYCRAADFERATFHGAETGDLRYLREHGYDENGNEVDTPQPHAAPPGHKSGPSELPD